MARLEDICSINMGQSPESSSYNESGEGMPFFQGNADFGELHPKVRIWCNAPTKIAECDECEINDPISVTYVSHQHVDAIVTGNNNIVANDHSSVVTGNNNSIGQSNKESLINQWLKAIGQNLISNGVWYILCILGGIVIARLAT